MKKMIFFVVVAFTILTIPSSFVNARNLEGQKKELNLFYSKDGKTYEVKGNKSEVIAPLEGVVSNDLSLIAYTVRKEGSHTTDPYIYTYNFDSEKKGVLFEARDLGEVYVSSWSPGSRYIVLYAPPHYLGGSVYHIFEAKTGIKKATIDVSTNYKWINEEEIIFTDPNCQDQRGDGNSCLPTKDGISKINLSSGTRDSILDLSDKGNQGSRINRIDPDDLSIIYSTKKGSSFSDARRLGSSSLHIEQDADERDLSNLILRKFPETIDINHCLNSFDEEVILLSKDDGNILIKLTKADNSISLLDENINYINCF